MAQHVLVDMSPLAETSLAAEDAQASVPTAAPDIVHTAKSRTGAATAASKSGRGTSAGKDKDKEKKRKKYTVRRVRELWTTEEHARFLQALDLFDRDWKKIEAFVGTKDVVQIRSHAQKHFIRVLKNQTGERIPPARQKRARSAGAVGLPSEDMSQTMCLSVKLSTFSTAPPESSATTSMGAAAAASSRLPTPTERELWSSPVSMPAVVQDTLSEREWYLETAAAAAAASSSLSRVAPLSAISSDSPLASLDVDSQADVFETESMMLDADDEDAWRRGGLDAATAAGAPLDFTACRPSVTHVLAPASEPADEQMQANFPFIYTFFANMFDPETDTQKARSQTLSEQSSTCTLMDKEIIRLLGQNLEDHLLHSEPSRSFD